MTREQAKESLIKLGIAEPTPEQITEFLNNLNGEIQKAKKETDALKEKAEKAAALEEELNKLKESGLTENEKVSKELEQAQKQIAELKKSNIKADVKAVLNKSGLSEEEYSTFIDGLIGDDSEKSIAMAKSLVKAFSTQKENAIKAHEKEILKGTETPSGNSSNKNDEKSDAEKIAETIAKGATTNEKSASEIVASYLN